MVHFDYKRFAKQVSEEAENLIPQDIASTYKQTFVERIYNFTFMAGEALANDENIKSEEQAKLITQLISEWTFHKYVDLLRSDIPFKYHDGILQKIAFVAYEIAKEAAIHDLPADKVCELVDFHLNKEFKKACENLLSRELITEEVYHRTLQNSHVDEVSYASNPEKKCRCKRHTSGTYKYTVIMLLVGIFALLLNIFFPSFAYIKAFNIIMIIFLSVYLGMVIMYMKLKK